MSLKQNSENSINNSILRKIGETIEDLNYGTITITVHNKRITQIETARKQRFDDIWKVEGGGGI